MKGSMAVVFFWLWLRGLPFALAGAAAAAGPEPFFFIQLSDPQLGMFTENADFAQETANLEFAVAAVNRLHPAFVVITGDLVNRPGDASQITEYRRIVGKIDPAIPAYNVAGNHDVQNAPTPASLAAYTNRFGPDHYAFRHRGLVGIVLNSSLICAPEKVPQQFAEQERWLKAELQQARNERARTIVIFQHHPWFVSSPNEPDQYFNIPRQRRSSYLSLLRDFGVNYVFCGHYHRNALARDRGLEVIITGAVGKPLGDDKSGLCIAIVREGLIEHRYYDFGDLPTRVNLGPPTAERAGGH